ncbi:PIN domain-containing protein [bacterium]|nr:PIN domain-containing protein [bacterium]
MPFYLLDSSAVVKYYVSEPGSEWVRRIVNGDGNTCFIANVSLAEVAAALARLQRNGLFGKAFVQRTVSRFKDELSGRLFIDHPVDHVTLEIAVNLAIRYPLNGYDAIQVASALLARKITGAKFTLISGDQQMLRAAKEEGLHTDDPEDHKIEDSQR